jgi:hypothetical protein
MLQNQPTISAIQSTSSSLETSQVLPRSFEDGKEEERDEEGGMRTLITKSATNPSSVRKTSAIDISPKMMKRGQTDSSFTHKMTATAGPKMQPEGRWNTEGSLDRRERKYILMLGMKPASCAHTCILDNGHCSQLGAQPGKPREGAELECRMRRRENVSTEGAGTGTEGKDLVKTDQRRYTRLLIAAEGNFVLFDEIEILTSMMKKALQPQHAMRGYHPTPKRICRAQRRQINQNTLVPRSSKRLRR